jgi:hypothetical protein
MEHMQIDGFSVKPNAYDVRIECETCHESKAGSLAYAWAFSHSHGGVPDGTRTVQVDAFEVECGDEVVLRDGRSGSVGGVFPPDRGIEVMIWIDEEWECLDGSHIPASWGTVLHAHSRRLDRVAVLMREVAEINGEPIEVVA